VTKYQGTGFLAGWNTKPQVYTMQHSPDPIENANLICQHEAEIYLTKYPWQSPLGPFKALVAVTGKDSMSPGHVFTNPSVAYINSQGYQLGGDKDISDLFKAPLMNEILHPDGSRVSKDEQVWTNIDPKTGGSLQYVDCHSWKADGHGLKGATGKAGKGNKESWAFDEAPSDFLATSCQEKHSIYCVEQA